mgnify:FL=1
MPIEVLVILIGLAFWGFWSFLMLITKWFKLWRYKPENDKGRNGEENRRRLASIQRPVLPERRSVFSPTSSSVPRQDSRSTRESSSGTRKLGFFKRR